jgi:hypothetical protein
MALVARAGRVCGDNSHGVGHVAAHDQFRPLRPLWTKQNLTLPTGIGWCGSSTPPAQTRCDCFGIVLWAPKQPDGLSVSFPRRAGRRPWQRALRASTPRCWCSKTSSIAVTSTQNMLGPSARSATMACAFERSGGPGPAAYGLTDLCGWLRQGLALLLGSHGLAGLCAWCAAALFALLATYLASGMYGNGVCCSGVPCGLSRKAALPEFPRGFFLGDEREAHRTLRRGRQSAVSCSELVLVQDCSVMRPSARPLPTLISRKVWAKGFSTCAGHAPGCRAVARGWGTPNFMLLISSHLLWRWAEGAGVAFAVNKRGWGDAMEETEQGEGEGGRGEGSGSVGCLVSRVSRPS